MAVQADEHEVGFGVAFAALVDLDAHLLARQGQVGAGALDLDGVARVELLGDLGNVVLDGGNVLIAGGILCGHFGALWFHESHLEKGKPRRAPHGAAYGRADGSRQTSKYATARPAASSRVVPGVNVVEPSVVTLTMPTAV
ncbi:hypothetical protein D3C87_1528260 [compost metagenome]